MVRYHKSFDVYRLLKSQRRDWETEITVIWGPTGTGKSRFCHESYPDAYWAHSGHWFDGYTGQETVIFDEFYGHVMSWSDLLRITDRYPYQVQKKGGTVNFVARRIVFTSNVHPSLWYDKEKIHCPIWENSPFARRITRLIFAGSMEEWMIDTGEPFLVQPIN